MRRRIAHLRYHAARITEHKAELFWIVAYFLALGVTALHWEQGRLYGLGGTIRMAWAFSPIPLFFSAYQYRFRWIRDELSIFEEEQLKAVLVGSWAFWLMNTLISNRIIREDWNMSRALAFGCALFYAWLLAYVLQSFERYHREQDYGLPEQAEEYTRRTMEGRAKILREAIDFARKNAK